MSEYLDRLKQRRDATPPPGNAPNVQSNVTFRKAIEYIERLETRLKEADDLNTDQREIVASALRCNIAANYVVHINGTPVSLQDKFYNKAIDAAIDVINEYYG